MTFTGKHFFFQLGVLKVFVLRFFEHFKLFLTPVPLGVQNGGYHMIRAKHFGWLRSFIVYFIIVSYVCSKDGIQRTKFQAPSEY